MGVCRLIYVHSTGRLWRERLGHKPGPDFYSLPIHPLLCHLHFTNIKTALIPIIKTKPPYSNAFNRPVDTQVMCTHVLMNTEAAYVHTFTQASHTHGRHIHGTCVCTSCALYMPLGASRRVQPAHPPYL